MANQTRIFNIDGMTCENCAKSIHNVVGQLEGVDTVSVSLENNQATITFDDSKVTAESLAAAIDDAGFEATVAN